MNTSAAWDAAYRDRGEEGVSWYAPAALPVLDLVDRLDLDHGTRVLDAGGGASPLVDGLLDRGFTDLTVLDLSAQAVELAGARLGDRADAVSWLVQDVLTWTPPHPFDLWHDRAVLHFMIDTADRAAYLRALRAGTRAGSLVVLATFAPDGPEQCSGLPVVRYDAAGLALLLGPDFNPIEDSREEHHTPWDSVQPFTRAVFRRRAP